MAGFDEGHFFGAGIAQICYQLLPLILLDGAVGFRGLDHRGQHLARSGVLMRGWCDIGFAFIGQSARTRALRRAGV